MKRGEVWIVSLDPVVGHEQAGKRPALIVSADILNLGPAGLVAVLPITSKQRRLPSRIPLVPPEGGVIQESWIITEQIRTVSKRRIVGRFGGVTPETMAAVETCLRLLLDLD